MLYSGVMICIFCPSVWAGQGFISSETRVVVVCFGGDWGCLKGGD